MTNYQLQIKSFVFGPFETNCYVVSDEQQILLVDPACAYESEQQQLLTYIENQKSKIKNQKSKIKNLQLSIVATHGHLDHLWGAAWACAKWNTPVLMHEADIPMAKAMQSQYDLFGIPATAEDFPIEELKSKIKNQKLPISNHQLPMTNVSILSTPGHTPGSICLYFQKSKITNHQSPGASSRLTGGAASAEEGFSPITNPQSPLLFSGDTLFQMGYGRTDLPGGNYSRLMNSLDSLFALPSDVQVFPGHGEPTTIGAETGYYQSPITNYQ